MMTIQAYVLVDNNKKKIKNLLTKYSFSIITTI